MNFSSPRISGITNQAEAHVSAASFHLDLSLFRVQAPDEYRDIGKSLSPRRKNEADEGQCHRTAVELGYLFGGIVPSVPDLVRAYGTRCSELANSSTFNPKGSFQHGLFANEVGVDGTSVWAAATSGDAAIAVLLLACMLSCMWDPPAAISIWMQLIAERKRALARSGNPLEIFACREGSLTRDQIAAWHTSTHAWRLTADEANVRRRNQLLLIINNLGLPVNTRLSVSESVISAWRTAMITVDQLVAGKPQCVQTGAPLLGLAAWHLYPDMAVYCHGNHGKPIDVHQNDPLVEKGGVMTLGLKDMRHSGDGIYWSLPLAHLRYYGRPVQSKALLSSSSSRTSIEDLILVALGSLVRRWCSCTSDIVIALTILKQIGDYIEIGGNLIRRENSWVAMLASAADCYLKAEAELQAEKLQLIRCGQRVFPRFVDDPKADTVFGLSSPRTLLRLLPGNAARVQLLRHIAQDYGDYRRLMIIQCRTGCPNSLWELSSVEELQSLRKRPLETESGPNHPVRRQFRWLNSVHMDKDPSDCQPRSEEIRLKEPIPWFWAPHGYQWQGAPREFYAKILEDQNADLDWREMPSVTVRSLLAFGDPDIAALYCIDLSYWFKSPNHIFRTVGYNKYRRLPNIFIANHVSWALENNLLSRESLFTHLEEGKFSADMHRSLKALLSVKRLYSDLVNATVDLRVAEYPLYKHAWIPATNHGSRHHPFHGYSLNRDEMFACIARFESGSFNLHSSAMSRVLAISSGNSIYVASCLLQDPCEPRSSIAIERVVGNLGKTGMAFLICPDIPDVRPRSDAPHLISHSPFDGEEKDCFNQTCLQLSFTGWELPIDVGSRGNRDVEASYVEAAIQLFDRGKWASYLRIVTRHALTSP